MAKTRGSHAHSFCEWVVGANYVSRKKVKATRRTVANLSWQTDDENDTDTIALSIPRAKRQAKNARAKQEKQVRFAPTLDAKSEDVKVSETESASSKSPESDLELDPDCPCGDCTKDRRKLKHTSQANDTSEATDTEVSYDTSTCDDTEEEIDPDCPCGECVSARRKLKKRKQGSRTPESTEPESDAEIHAKHKVEKAKQKSAKNSPKADGRRDKNKQEALGNRFEAESDTAVDSSASEDKSKQKSKSDSKKKGKEGKKAQAVPSEDDTEEEHSNRKGKNKSKKQEDSAQNDQTKDMGGKSSKKKAGAQVDQSGEKEDAERPATSKKGKKSKSFSQPPPRRPDLLMPVNAQVLQVEHSVECADDPRPNAFYDSEHGVMRVYHGAAYGNPYGALYPKRWSHNVPLGVPHPSQNPWAYGFAPSHAPIPPPQGFVPPLAQGPGPGNAWYQGQFTTRVPGPVTPEPKDGRGNYNNSPTLRAAAKRDNNNNNYNNNVGPVAPRNSQAGSARSGQKAKNNEGWGVQRAQNSNEAANNGWSPHDSQKLQESLEKIGSQNGSKSGSKKNDDGWGDGGNDGWGFADNVDNKNNANTEWNNDAAHNGNNVGNGAWADSGNDNTNYNNNDNNDNVEGGGNNNNDRQDNTTTWGASGDQITNAAADGNVGGTEKNGSPRPQNPKGSPMPGAWPQSGSGGNVFGGSAQVSNSGTRNSPSQVPPSSAGNVVGNVDEWGGQCSNTWGNTNVANSTGGFWESTQGKADAKVADNTPASGW